MHQIHHRRIHSLPPEYESRLEAELNRRSHSLSVPKPLAAAVQRLSDHYTGNPLATSPWTEPWAQTASIAYYFPLNYARNRAVAREARRLGFLQEQELDAVIDIGSGMGSALFAWHDEMDQGGQDSPLHWPQRKIAIDVSPQALALGGGLSPMGLDEYETRTADTRHWPNHLPDLTRSLILASYVLTELEEIPAWWLKAEALAILEPSTQQDGRRLMKLRARLLEEGYQIWAPCTHEGRCPLLTHSQKDWCHDRIHWQGPHWWEALERELPMKNRTLTFSYLLARRSLAPPRELRRLARLTGDALEEKGKTRQSVCRGEEREFLAWFPQRMNKDENLRLELDRGSLVRLEEEGLKRKSSEVRLKAPSQIRELLPDEPPSEDSN